MTNPKFAISYKPVNVEVGDRVLSLRELSAEQNIDLLSRFPHCFDDSITPPWAVADGADEVTKVSKKLEQKKEFVRMTTYNVLLMAGGDTDEDVAAFVNSLPYTIITRLLEIVDEAHKPEAPAPGKKKARRRKS